jgi:flagellar L-ring protein precursor FlgH
MLPAPPLASGRQQPSAASPRPNPAGEMAAAAGVGGPLTIRNTSWTYEAPQAARVYRLNDIVTIRVDEISRMAAEGNLESRRNSLYDSILQEWVKLDSLDSLNPAAQKEGDPRVQMANNSLNRADSRLQSRQSLTFNIAARVVDIRPNGDLVLEARKTIVYNDNAWETALSGICRPVDIAADNVVLSRDLLDLQVRTQERGEMRDGYRRGWFAKLVGRLFPY